MQLLAVSTYARAKGILLKGDIPIGISRSSVEAWVEAHYFHLNGQAGAPPDAFSVNGQNWGFPTYNWEVMEKTITAGGAAVSPRWQNTLRPTASTIS